MNNIKWFLFLSLLKYMTFQIDEGNKFNIIENAKMDGYDLTNPEDHYFHDICIHFKFIKKDVTLDYRRMYYFFPNKETYSSTNSTKIFQRPIRNNSNECFNESNSINLFSNAAFLCFLPIFIFQFSLLILVLTIKKRDSLRNTPYNKLISGKKIKNKNVVDSNNNISNYKNSYTQLIPEITQNNINDSRLQAMKVEDNNNKNDNIDMDISEQKLNEEKYNNNILTKNSDAPLNNESTFENEQKDNNQNSEPSPSIEKSKDNYTFGANLDRMFKFSNNASIKEEKKKENEKEVNDPEKNEDKMKRIQLVYEQMNPSLKKLNKSSNKSININADTPFGIQKKEEKFYVREEYFYFGYLLARMEDKRTLLQIYFDLLEQCQIIFKFLYGPFNIYEDRKIQLIYYFTKITIYFLVNCLLINNSVINDIYDNRNFFLDDLKRSFISTIITYAISSVIYYFTNIKKVLIKRRYKLMNLKINDMRLNNEIAKFSLTICLSFLFNKIIVLLFISIIIFLYSSYVCFCFCNVYYYTQFILLKCVLLSILISQNTPIIACFIPAFIRKLSLKKKSVKLYEFNKLIELLFIPW